ncbi:MAG: hypothetical protein KIT31_38085 [Deltaproteobacteria bacterium]|nr:hypothetical protein [Deltaproteobacteria bacterium]
MDPTKYERGHPLIGGLVAGLIGGAVLAAMLAGMSAARGGDVWVAMKGAAAPFLGERAQVPGFDAGAVALGLVCHFGIAIVWSVLFAAISYGLSRGATVVAGALWGVVVWFGMYYLVLPVVGLPQIARSTPLSDAILTHVVFGLAVGLGFLPFQHERPTAPPVRRAPMGAG